MFIAGLFVLAARELAAITHEDRLLDAAAAMSDVVLAHGWDGEWFVRAYDHFGSPVGSATCDEGQIFIEPQGMCVMAGIGVEDGRAARALASVADQLATEHGIVLLRPAYQRYHAELGEITSYPPGYKENGSVFCHTNPWVIVASTIVGDAERALDYHLRINPSAREAISDVHRSEPYVYAQTIAGREAPTFGEAKNSWLTGTAAWSYVAVTQWILGIRPDHDGAAHRPVPAVGVDRVHRAAALPRCDVRDHGAGERQDRSARRRRRRCGGQRRAGRGARLDRGRRGGRAVASAHG